MKKTKTPKRCKHVWVWTSHNDFRDGEYSTCKKCGRTKFGTAGRTAAEKQRRLDEEAREWAYAMDGGRQRQFDTLGRRLT
jgi:hypothetical protein